MWTPTVPRPLCVACACLSTAQMKCPVPCSVHTASGTAEGEKAPICLACAWLVACQPCLFKGATSRTTCPCPVGLCMSVALQRYTQRVNCPLRAACHWSLDSELSVVCAKPENAPYCIAATFSCTHVCLSTWSERSERLVQYIILHYW